MPDKPPYSLCAKSFAKGFKHAGFYTEKAYSSELDNEKVLEFNPDIIMCFNFSELNEGFLNKVFEKNKNCIFIFNFLTELKSKNDSENVKKLEAFEGKKVILTADKSNLKILPNATYIPNGINHRQYKSKYKGYTNGITVMSNPNNTNVLKIITNLIVEFGKINFYSDEFDYLNSLDNELWKTIDDTEINKLYRESYSGDIISEKERSLTISTSFINVVPKTQTKIGVDFRILEVCASSSFVICEENNEIKRLFETGKEIETYTNVEELVDKIKFYLKKPAIARYISDNGRGAIVNNHPIEDRIKRIINIIKKEYDI